MHSAATFAAERFRFNATLLYQILNMITANAGIILHEFGVVSEANQAFVDFKINAFCLCINNLIVDLGGVRKSGGEASCGDLLQGSLTVSCFAIALNGDSISINEQSRLPDDDVTAIGYQTQGFVLFGAIRFNFYRG